MMIPTPVQVKHSEHSRLFPTGLQARYTLLLGVAYIILFPVILLAGKSLLEPIISGSEALLVGKLPPMPLYFWVKLLAYGVLGLGGVLWLRLRLELAFIAAWAGHTPRPHPLHVDYHPCEPYSVWALAKWKLYRLLRLFTLPGLVLFVLFISILLQFWLLNVLFDTLFMRLPLLHILGIFWLCTLGLLLVASLANTAWQSIGTTFGAFAAATEPLRPLPLLFNRCNRVLPYSKYIGVLMASRLLLAVVWLASLGYCLWRYDLSQPGLFELPYALMVLVLMAISLGEVLLNYGKWCLYHAALQRFYTQLPQFIQDAFTPPASLYEEDMLTPTRHEATP